MGEARERQSSWFQARDWILELALILWVARVSVVSTTIGAILFIFIAQVQDVFLEVIGSSALYGGFFWVLFLVSALIFWALPVHYAARRDIEYDPLYAGKILEGPAIWVPRFLGSFCLLSIAIGASRAHFGLINPNDAEVLLQTAMIAGAAFLLSIGLLLFLIKRREMFDHLPKRVGTWLMLSLAGAFFALFVVNPLPFSRVLGRALLLPLLLGGWVPFFAWLAYVGRKYRVPSILGLFLVLEALSMLFGDNHNVRRLLIDSHASPVTDGSLAEETAKKLGYTRETIGEAIERWRIANKCFKPVPIGSCPRPIVVAASGGASRAGFFTAGVLGDLLDRSENGGLEGVPDFGRQLFAISTVSGSSTGAAFFVAALHKAEQRKPPCREDSDGLSYLTGRPSNWRQCMEQILAGDFISPTLYGFVYKDAIRGLGSLIGWNDRAAVLEIAWEDRFCRITTSRDCRENEADGMRAAFLSISGRGDSTAPRPWFPILLLNATDVDTGRRVVISPLDPRVGSDKRLFPDAYDLHDLLVDQTNSKRGPAGLWDRPQQNYINRDVRLSTAALLSARFPVISPPGNILNAQEQIMTRTIDGGYFENYGAATAADIVEQLRQAQLKPFVIEITNDPEFLVPDVMENASESCRIEGVDPLKLRTPPLVYAPKKLWFSGIVGPIEGLLGSRGAQGGRALRALSDLGDNNFLHIYVRPYYFQNILDGTCEVAAVSMSWWLSKTVQRYLDEQINLNCKAIDIAILKIRKASDLLLGSPTDHCAPS